MINTSIPNWIEGTLFECDITNKSYNYKELNVVWYDKIDTGNPMNTIFYQNFMLVKQGEGFEKIKNYYDGWSLSDRPLEQVLKENIILFFTDFLDVDSIHDKGDLVKKTDLKSWTELFRRLSIPNYEIARHRIKEAKNMEYFSELTEFQLLQSDVLSKFVNSFNS